MVGLGVPGNYQSTKITTDFLDSTKMIYREFMGWISPPIQQWWGLIQVLASVPPNQVNHFLGKKHCIWNEFCKHELWITCVCWIWCFNADFTYKIKCIWIRSLPFVSLVEGVQHFAPSQWQSHDNAMWEPSAGYHHNAQHALAGSALKGSAVVHLWFHPPGVESVFSRGTGNNGTAERLLLLRIVPWHLKTMLCLLLDMKLSLYPQTCKWKITIFFLGDTSSKGPLSIAMLVYRSVQPLSKQFEIPPFLTPCSKKLQTETASWNAIII